MTAVEEQRRILESCHSDPSSGHFGTMKTVINLTCRMPEQAGSTMIQCSTCKEWFHVGVCVDVPTQAFDSATKWFCNKCNY